MRKTQNFKAYKQRQDGCRLRISTYFALIEIMAPDSASFRPAASMRLVLIVQMPRIPVPPVSSIRASSPSSLLAGRRLYASCNIALDLLNAISDRNRNCDGRAGAIAFPACRRVEVHRISRLHMRTQPRRRRSFLLLNALVSAGAWCSETEVYGYTKLRSSTGPQF